MNRTKTSTARRESGKVGVAWYRKEQWSQLLQISEDAEQLEGTYEEWLGIASEHMTQIEAAGIPAQKVDLDVNELLAWCQSRGLPVNAESRARFTAEKVRAQSEEPKDLSQSRR